MPPLSMLKIRAEVGRIPGCTGSSRFECGDTSVFCVVHGPVDMQKTEELDRVSLDIRWRDHTLINARAYEKYFCGVVEKILQGFILLDLDAYKMIQVCVNIAGSSRNVLFCAANAVVLALVNAGIPLSSMFYASTSFLNEEEVFVFNEERLLYTHAFGEITEDSTSRAKSHIEYIREFMKHCLKGQAVGVGERKEALK
jgi:exosome complex component RRP46